MGSTVGLRTLQTLHIVGRKKLVQRSCLMMSTYVVERRYKVPLSEPNKPPSMRRRHNVYDVVEDKGKPYQTGNMTILLTEYVENLGQPGEQVEILARKGRELLLMKKAVYPTFLNLEKYAKNVTQESYSSKYVKITLDHLSKMVLTVTMNKETPWTIEPLHISVSFRKAHVRVPPSAIEMPKIPIKGPDMSLESKEFYVTVTINEKEKVVVRCRVHHWATNNGERLPWVPFPFKQVAPPVFEEDKQLADKLPPIDTLKMDEDELHEAVAKLKAKALAKRKL